VTRQTVSIDHHPSSNRRRHGCTAPPCRNCGASFLVSGPRRRAGDGDGAAAGGDGIGTGGIGGAVASLDCGKIRSLTKELSDEIALSALVRTAPAPSKYPENCSPMATKPCKA